MLKLEEMSAREIQRALLNNEFTAEDMIKELFIRIKDVDISLNSYITLCEESALLKAKEIDEKIKNKLPLGRLAGIPIAIKDNICTDGIRTTCASKILEDFIPPYDATIVKKLKNADAIIIGKTNMDEFAMGSSTENSSIKTTKNPWDLSRVPGGSSGGSAAAVGGGIAPLALGSDTGGSIRQPAAFCGVVGLKPTYGLVSRFGLIAFASSLDQIGPLGKNVEDCALCLEVIQGEDPMDSTSYNGEINKDYLSSLKGDIKGLKIAIPKEFFNEHLDSEISSSIKASIDIYKRLGAIISEVSIPITDAGLSAYYIISSAEASSNLARFDGIRYGYRTSNIESVDDLIEKTRTEGFGVEVKRRIMLGTYALSSGYYDAYYNRAQKLRKKIREEFSELFEKYDVILGPVSPVLPFKCGENTDDPLKMYMADIYTVNVNLAGLPALSLPCGFSKEGLPIGLQLIGGHFQEAKLFNAAYALEKELSLTTVNHLWKEEVK